MSRWLNLHLKQNDVTSKELITLLNQHLQQFQPQDSNLALQRLSLTHENLHTLRVRMNNCNE